MGDGLTLMTEGNRSLRVKVIDMIDRVRIETEPGVVADWAIAMHENLTGACGGQKCGLSNFSSMMAISNSRNYNMRAPVAMHEIESAKEKDAANIRELPKTLDYQPILPVLLPASAANPDIFTSPPRRCQNECGVAIAAGKNWDISVFLERFKVRANDHAETEPYKRFGLSYNRWLASGLSVVVTGGAEQFVKGSEFKGRLATNGSTQVDVVVEK